MTVLSLNRLACATSFTGRQVFDEYSWWESEVVQAKSGGTGSTFSFHLLNALALKAILSQGVFQTQHLRSELKKKKKKKKEEQDKNCW